ncbi:hypothetical protein B5M47_01255 [candidate division CPR3 bacterium 4484_211]|uniref:Ferredoxin n=1 Tax=candidate division CPR3 bacterium 4484_211 TaxID=1968527 RepID=A0A1W9NZ11_UNCC3|nr:MAG: hypothetical protein B5M47_01255 [candidate division CPR3 bacterium 4484_211]
MSDSKIEVKVNKETCIGCGTCVNLASETFQIGTDGKSSVVNQEGNTDEEKLTAAQSCPVEAIEAVDKESGEKLWPK